MIDVQFGAEMAVVLSEVNERKIVIAMMDKTGKFHFGIHGGMGEGCLALVMMPDDMGMIVSRTGIENNYRFLSLIKQNKNIADPLIQRLNVAVREEFNGIDKDAPLPRVWERVGGLLEEDRETYGAEFFFVCTATDEKLVAEYSAKH